MSWGHPEPSGPPLQVNALCTPADDHQAKKHEARRIGSHGIETSAGGHSNCGFHKDGRSGGHPHHAARFAQNRARTKEADALHNVRSDSRASRIAKTVSDFAR